MKTITFTTMVSCEELILSVMQYRTSSVKPNKLRKLVCKDKSFSWNDFSEALDSLVKKKIVSRNGDFLVYRSTANEESLGKTAELQKPEDETERDETGGRERYQRKIKLPKIIIELLTKKNSKKLRNIEKNTSSSINLVPTGDNKHYIAIIESESKEDSMDQTKKRVNFAASLLIKMNKLCKEKAIRDQKLEDGEKKKDRASVEQETQEDASLFVHKRKSKSSEDQTKKKKKRKRDKFY